MYMYVSVEFKTNKQTWILLNKKSYLLSSMLFRYVPFDAKFEDFNKNVFISKGEFQSLKIENVKNLCASDKHSYNMHADEEKCTSAVKLNFNYNSQEIQMF